MQKDGRKMKKAAFFASVAALSALTAFTTSCNQEQASGKLVYTLPTQTEIEAGVAFTPDFKVGGGTSVKLVSLQTPTASETQADGLNFTPDVTGRYTYTVVFTNGTATKTETVVFTAADNIQPTLSALEDKQAEIGFYTNLSADLQAAAAKATDNVAKTLSVYPKSLTFNGVETPLDKNATSLYLGASGEYTVTLIVEDYSGNKTEGSYKIIATDSVKPVLETPEAFVVWENGGKAVIPEINVVDVELDTLTVTAKTADGTSVTVENGMLTGITAGEYVLTYVAKDKTGNVTSADVKLHVKERGTISTFATAGETAAWRSISTRHSDGEAVVYTESDSAQMEYVEHFLVGNWAQFTKLSIDIKNMRAAELTVQAELLIGGEWKKLAPQTFAAGTMDGALSSVAPVEGVYEAYLADYGVTATEGMRLTFTSSGGVHATVDNVVLVDGDDVRTTPTVQSGFGTGTYALRAGGVAVLTGEKLVATAQQNAWQGNIYATADANVRIVLKFGDKEISARYSLKKGENNVYRLPDVESAQTGLLQSGLTGIEIFNEEEYPVTLSVVASKLSNVTGNWNSDLYAKVSGAYGVSYGEQFVVPYPFTVSNKYYTDLKVVLQDQDGENIGSTAVGNALATEGENALSAGNYKLMYIYKDVFGAQKSLVYTLAVGKKVLDVEVELPALFLGEDSRAPLAAPTLVSDVYGEEQLQNASVEIAWREKGKTKWNVIAADEAFAPISSKLHEFRYVVELNGARRERIFEKFVHADKLTIDFEPESAAGKYAHAGQGNPTFDSRFLYDGGYYNYKPDQPQHWWITYNEWSVSGGTSLTYLPTANGWAGFLIRPKIDSDMLVNTVSFWLNADVGMNEQQVEIGKGYSAGSVWQSSWIATNLFTVSAGAHYYTLSLDTPIKASEISSWIIKGRSMIRYSVDDITFSYVDHLSFSEDFSCEDTNDLATPYEVKKPAIQSEIYSIDELAKAVYTLTYKPLGGTAVKVPASADGKYLITFPNPDVYTLEWTVSLDGKVITCSDEVTVGSFVSSVDVPLSGYVGEALALNKPTSQETLTSVTAEVRHEDDEQWTALSLSGETFTFTPEKSGSYIVRYVSTATVDNFPVTSQLEREIWVREAGGKVVMDMEPMTKDSESWKNFGCSDYAYDSTNGAQILDNANIISSEQAHSGNYSAYLQTWSGWWRGFENLNVSVPKATYNVVEFWAYTPQQYNMNATMQFKGYNGTQAVSLTTAEKTVTFKPGWNYYRILLKEAKELDKIHSFNLGQCNQNSAKIWIDDMSFSYAETTAIPEKAQVGSSVTLPTLTYGGETLTPTYLAPGATEYKAAEGELLMAKVGTYMIAYKLANGESITYGIVVNEPDTKDFDKTVPTEAMMDSKVTFPTLEGYVLEGISYKKKGGKETKIDGTEVTFTEVGEYEITYKFVGFTRTYKIVIGEPEVNLSKELPEKIVIGDSIVIPTASYKTETGIVAQYRERGTDVWLNLPENNTIVFDKTMTCELRYSFEKFETVYSFVVDVPEVTWSTPFVGTAKQDETMTLPNATFNGETAQIFYRRADVDVWTPCDNGTVTFKKLTNYFIRYQFAGFEIVKTIRVKDPLVLVDFEDEDPLMGGVWHTYWTDKNQYQAESIYYDEKTDNHSLKITGSINSWAGVSAMNINLGKKVTKIKVKTICNVDYLRDGGVFYIYGKADGKAVNQYCPQPTVIPQGENWLIIELPKAIDTLVGFSVSVRNTGNFYTALYIDDISLVE